MPLKEATTRGLYRYTVGKQECVQERQVGKVLASPNLDDIDSAITANNGQCDIYVNPNAFIQIAYNRPDLVVISELDRDLNIRISDKPDILSYIPQNMREEAATAIKNGGFVVINDSLRDLVRWDATPNRDVSVH